MFCKKWYQNHIWGNWEEGEQIEYNVERSRSGKIIKKVRIIIQKRKCLRCGFVQFDKEKTELSF